jgi:hypothetical protein
VTGSTLNASGARVVLAEGVVLNFLGMILGRLVAVGATSQVYSRLWHTSMTARLPVAVHGITAVSLVRKGTHTCAALNNSTELRRSLVARGCSYQQQHAAILQPLETAATGPSSCRHLF